MMPSAVRNLLYTQACLYGGLALCVILKPSGLSANGGISFYGIYIRTILPFTLALLGSAYFTFRVSRQLVESKQAIIKYALYAISLLEIGILVTPDSLSSLIANIHEICGSVLFIIQLLLSFWLIKRYAFRWQPIVFTLVELAGGIASFIYLSPVHGWLIESQIVFQVGFGAMLYYTLKFPWISQHASTKG